MSSKEIENITFSKTLSTGQGVKQYYPSPWAGTITRVTMNWPNGCDGLVGIAVHHGSKLFLPSNENPAAYYWLNDTTMVFDVQEDVRQDEQIWVDFQNTDASFTHTPTVNIKLERENY